MPDFQKVLPRQKRVVVIGFSRLLVASTKMLDQPPLLNTYPGTLSALLQMITDASLANALSSRDAQVDANEIFLQDWEEQAGTGYQSNFALLKSSTTQANAQKSSYDFLQGKDVREYLGGGLKHLNTNQPQKVMFEFVSSE